MARWPLLGLGSSTQATVFSLQVIFYAIISLFFYPIIYGRLVETIKNTPSTSFQNLLKDHFINYLLFSILLIIPSFWFPFILAKIGYISPSIINTIYSVVHCVSIFMLPLLFLNRCVFSSIPKGIKTLFHNLWTSIPLILLAIFLSFEQPLVAWSTIHIYRPDSIVTIVGIGFLSNVIYVYLQLLIFTKATIIITEQKGENAI